MVVAGVGLRFGAHTICQASPFSFGIACGHGWAVPSLLDATPPPSRSGPKAPGGGGHWRGGFREGRWGGGSGGSVGGGVQVGQFGVVGGGGHRLPLPPLALPHG